MSARDAGIAWLSAQAGAQARLIDALHEPAWLIDGGSLRLRHANAAAVPWLGANPSALVGRDAVDLLPTLEDQAFWFDVTAGQASGLFSELALHNPQGQPVRVLRRIAPVPAAPDQTHDWLVTLRDLQREHRAQQESDALVGELRATLEATADGLLVTDLDGQVRAFNRRFATLWSLPELALSERNDAALLNWLAASTADPAHFKAQFHEAASERLSERQWRITLLDGRQLNGHSCTQWRGGQPHGRVHSFRAAQPRRKVFVAPPPAQQDQVTGLPDRTGFVRRLDEALGQAARSAGHLAVVCVELDRQALYGLGAEPAAQSQVLDDVVRSLRAALLGPHVMARLGCARFAVLLPQSGEAAALAVVNRWQSWARHCGPGPNPLAGLAPVVGVAVYPHAGLLADDLLGGAEAALEQARRQGLRSEVHRLTGASDSQRQQRLESILRQGLDEATPFWLAFQPRLADDDTTVQAVEALVRWRDGGQGDLLPIQFLPQLERAGLASVLDDWVLERALRQAAQWRAQGHDWAVTINVGGSQWLRPGLARRVAAMLEHTGLPASCLELDVTEDIAAIEPDTSLSVMMALRELGVRLVLDQFGRGPMNLATLRRLPWSAVKIDRSLLRHSPGDAAERAALEGVVALVAAVGLQRLAAGVETAAQREQVRQLGCSGWQGFLAMPPMDLRRLEHRLMPGERRAGPPGPSA